MAAPPAPRAAQALANESRGTPGSAAGAHAHPEDNVRSAPPAAKRGRWAGEQLDSADGGAFTASERAQVHTAAPQGTAAGSSATQEPFPPERVAARDAWLGRVLAVIQGRADDAAALPPEPSTTLGSAREWLDTIDDTKEQCTPLMHAAKRGRVRILTALITRYHANVNFQSPRSGYTALIVAAFSGHAACVSALLSHGASTRARNRYGEDALRVATSRGYTSIMSALREAEAAAGMRLSEAAAAAAASSAHTAGDAQDVALPKVGMAMRLRGVQPDDTGVLRALYKLGQADHIHDAASARIHNSWTDRILSSDFANPYESYATQPRTAMWVATLAPADALRLLHAPA
ncbi:MAG: ankyrin repeat domain-containing protein, partial [Methanobacteriota archaeon]